MDRHDESLFRRQTEKKARHKAKTAAALTETASSFLHGCL